MHFYMLTLVFVCVCICVFVALTFSQCSCKSICMRRDACMCWMVNVCLWYAVHKTLDFLLILSFTYTKLHKISNRKEENRWDRKRQREWVCKIRIEVCECIYCWYYAWSNAQWKYFYAIEIFERSWKRFDCLAMQYPKHRLCHPN